MPVRIVEESAAVVYEDFIGLWLSGDNARELDRILALPEGERNRLIENTAFAIIVIRSFNDKELLLRPDTAFRRKLLTVSPQELYHALMVGLKLISFTRNPVKYLNTAKARYERLRKSTDFDEQSYLLNTIICFGRVIPGKNLG